MQWHSLRGLPVPAARSARVSLPASAPCYETTSLPLVQHNFLTLCQTACASRNAAVESSQDSDSKAKLLAALLGSSGLELP